MIEDIMKEGILSVLCHLTLFDNVENLSHFQD